MSIEKKDCFACKFSEFGVDVEPCLSCFGWSNFAYKMSDNQEAKADYGKEELTLVPRRIIHDICAIRMYGNKKYGDPDNWKQVEPERYRNAAFRHFLAYLDDPYGVDKESGLPHRWHLCCNLAFLCELEDGKNEIN